MHLFVSFILKAIAVFVKDVVLYEIGEVDNCSSGTVSSLNASRLFRFGAFQTDELRVGGLTTRSHKSLFTRAAEKRGRANYQYGNM